MAEDHFGWWNMFIGHPVIICVFSYQDIKDYCITTIVPTKNMYIMYMYVKYEYNIYHTSTE